MIGSLLSVLGLFILFTGSWSFLPLATAGAPILLLQELWRVLELTITGVACHYTSFVNIDSGHNIIGAFFDLQTTRALFDFAVIDSADPRNATTFFPNVTIAETGPETGGGSLSRLPLDVFSRGVPPGWQPGLRKYPMRRYQQLLRLWWMQSDVPEHQAGAAIVGRLRGAAFQYAMRLSQDRLNTDRSEAALYRT